MTRTHRWLEGIACVVLSVGAVAWAIEVWTSSTPPQPKVKTLGPSQRPMARVVTACEMYRRQFDRDPGSLEALLRPQAHEGVPVGPYLRAGEAADAWGTAMRLEFSAAGGLRVRSAGPNGRWFDADDLLRAASPFTSSESTRPPSAPAGSGR